MSTSHTFKLKRLTGVILIMQLVMPSLQSGKVSAYEAYPAKKVIAMKNDDAMYPWGEDGNLMATSSMPMWYYGCERIFRNPIPTEFDFAYIDKSGHIVSEGPFCFAREYHGGVAVTSLGSFEFENGKWKYARLEAEEGRPALIPLDGGVIYAPAIRAFVDAYYDDLAVVEARPTDEKHVKPFFELADKRGKIVTNLKWFEAKAYSEGLAAVKMDPTDISQITKMLKMKIFSQEGIWGYFDKDGKSVISPQFTSAQRFSEGLAAVIKSGSAVLQTNMQKPTLLTGGSYCYIDKSGSTKIPGPYMQARPFSNSLAAVMQNGKWGYIDKQGKVVVSCDFDWAGDFKENLAPVEREQRVGYINADGKVMIPFKFKNGREFADGLAPVTIDGRRWGYIDAAGKFLIEPEFQGAFSFSDGRALVYIDRPTQVPSLAGLGMFYMFANNCRLSGQINLARSACLKLTEIDGQGFWGNKARNFLDTALPDHDVSPEVMKKYKQGSEDAQKGQFADAERAYLEALRQDPGFFPAAGALAYVLNQQGRFNETVELIKVSLIKKPGYARGYVRMAQAYLGLGNKAMSEECLQKAKALDPVDTALAF